MPVSLLQTLKNELVPNAKIYYQSATEFSHPVAGIMMQRHIPLTFLQLRRYDVSVSDIVMTGRVPCIIDSLNQISKRSKEIYSFEKHGTIKIFFNKKMKSIKTTDQSPMVGAAMHNFASLVLKSTGLGLSTPILSFISADILASTPFASKVTPELIRESLADITISELLTLSTNTLFGKVTSGRLKNKVSSSPMTHDLLSKATIVDFITALKKHVRPLLKSLRYDKSVDYNISDKKYAKPEIHSASNLQKIKLKASMLMGDDLIIKVGTQFNRNHAGVVVDLDTHSIAIDELVYFLARYENDKKFVNCFLTSGNLDLL